MKRSMWAGVLCLSLLAIACCVTTAAAQDAAATITVEKIAFGSGVENRELVGAAAEFPAGTAQVWCWTRLAAKSAPATVKHVWSLDGKTMLEVPLTLASGSGRTWSHKNVRPGTWKVEVVSESGAVLGSASFTVK